MFFLKLLSHTIQLPPHFFTSAIHDELRRRLVETVEGSCSGRYGYIVAVAGIENFGNGKIIPTTGWAEFDVKYTAILFRPLKNEVMDGNAATVNKMGLFLSIGPLSVFISSHGIPPDIKFDPSSNPPAYVSEDQSVKIEKGSTVRCRIIGTRIDATEFFAVGTIKDDFLGLMPDVA